MRHHVACLVLIVACVLNGKCLADGHDELGNIIPWFQDHPDQVDGFAASLIRNDVSLGEKLPRELHERVMTALSEHSPTQILWVIAKLAARENDLPLADAFERKLLAEKRRRLLEQDPSIVNAEVALLGDETRRPRDAVIEINYPASVSKVHYLAAADGLARADLLLAQSPSQFGAPDRRHVQGWRDRMAWILGEPRMGVSPMEQADAVSVSGRVLIDGEPARLIRVALLKAQPHLVSGGGYRTFIHGLDVFASGVVSVPDSDFYDAMTDGSGRFEMKIKPGGPYSFVALPVQRAVTRIEGASVQVRHTDCFRKNLGWNVKHTQEPQDLGTIEITWIQPGEKPPHPVTDIMTPQQPSTAQRGEELLFPFRVANLGGHPLEISGMKADCLCSTIHGESGVKDTIKFPVTLKPSESVQWNVTVRTNSGMAIGDHTKSILLLANDPLEAYSRIDFRFSVSEQVSFEPSVLRFQLAQGHEVLEQTVRLVSSLSPHPKIGDPSTDESLPVTVEVANDGASAVVTVDPARLPTGRSSYYYELNLPVLVNGNELLSSPVVVFCRRADVLVEPTFFDLHRVRQGTMFERSVSLSSEHDLERFESIESLNSHIRVDSYKKVDGKIEIRFEISDAGPGTLRVNLRKLRIPAKSEQRSVPFIDIPIKWQLAE